MERWEIWWAYVISVTGDIQQKDMPGGSGIDETTFSRWSSGKQAPTPQKAIAFARAYGRSPVEALIKSGFLTQKDAVHAVEIRRGLDDASDRELLAELGRRLTRGRPSPTPKLDDVVGAAVHDRLKGRKDKLALPGSPSRDRRRRKSNP